MIQMTKKKIFLAVFLLVMIGAVGFFLWRISSLTIIIPISQKIQTGRNNSLNNNSGSVSASANRSGVATSGEKKVAVSATDFMSPLPRASERVTKKPFGIFITPATSPVSPERFQGYHTGADFEIFPEELNAEVPVSAICDGKLLLKEYAIGYGGVAVEGCTLEGNPVTVVYGHLKLSSITAKVGDKLSPGEKLGILGKNKSAETDGERKHLHLGIHKGTSINILGYVQSKNSLSAWIDPCLYVCGK